MKELILLRGLPGSGKTTFAKSLGDNHIEADMWFIDEETGEYKFDASKLKYAHNWCQDVTENWMDDNEERIIVSNTFTTEKEMAPYVLLAVKYGYNITSLVVENRHGNSSVHNVPAETIEKMKSRFQIKLL